MAGLLLTALVLVGVVGNGVIAGGQRLQPLPSTYAVVETLHLTDDSRRRLNARSLDEIDQVHLSIDAASINGGLASHYEIDLEYDNLWAVGAKLTVLQGDVTHDRPLPRLPTFRGHLTNHSGAAGAVSATFYQDGSVRVHIYEGDEDVIVESASRFDTAMAPALNPSDHVLFRTSLDYPLGGTDEELHHSSVPVIGLHEHELHRPHRRELSLLNTLPNGPPYGRLSSCVASPALYTNNIGMVADSGFTSVVGGTESAVLAALASYVSDMNTIWEDQVGIRFLIGATIINLDTTGASGYTGPNEAPSSSGSRDSCGPDYVDAYSSRTVEGPGGAIITVDVQGGAGKLLATFANWVGLADPTCIGCSHWHLLTDCFPVPGTIGIAYTGFSCAPLNSRRGVVSDSGTTCSDCDVRLANGNAASLAYYTSTECSAGEHMCAAPVGLTSYTGTSTWRTFSHEIGHSFGAGHTFGLGGLMDYNTDVQFYDNGEVCTYMNSILANTGGSFQTTCLISGSAACGDGNIDTGTGEGCDDGNTDNGDGCDASCAKECGWSCSQVSNGAGTYTYRSTCTQMCGNGVIDAEYYEECDDASVCCVNCKLASGALCSNHECCTSSCSFETAATACGSGTGYCSDGSCVTTQTFCTYAIGGVGLTENTAECPIGGSSPGSLTVACAQVCRKDDGSGCVAGSSYGVPIDAGYLPVGTSCNAQTANPATPVVPGKCVLDAGGTTRSCSPTATCGNGAIEVGEECDDTSSCCDQSTCLLVTGAVCSSSMSSDCCSSNCTFETAETSCSSGSGFCQSGACVTSMALCGYTIGGKTALVNTASCSVGSTSPGDTTVACAQVCRYDDGSGCIAGNLVNVGNIEHQFLPAGTPCNAQTANPNTAGVVVQGVCVTDSGGTTRSCSAVDTCSLPSIAASSATGDPHIFFANGGQADFRGSHRAFYVFLSSPGYQFAPYFQEIDFRFLPPTGLKQLVHGSFMTQAAWRIRTAAGRELVIKADAMFPGTVEVLVIPSLVTVTQGQTPESVTLKRWQRIAFDEVAVETRMFTVAVESLSWQVNVTSKPIYNLVPPLLNDTHVHGRWAEEQRRFDIQIQGGFPQPEAHGIVGQSFASSTVHNGQTDEYRIETAPEAADSSGILPEMTTRAQAEGAIAGVYTDYRLEHLLSTEFVFSRYHLNAQTAHLPLKKRMALMSDFDGTPDKPWRGQREFRRALTEFR